MKIISEPTHSQEAWVDRIQEVGQWAHPETVESFVEIAYLAATTEEINPSVLLAMCIVEKGWSMAGGYVPIEANNFGNIGATDGSGKYDTFPTVFHGLKVMAQHLSVYAGRVPANILHQRTKNILIWGYLGIAEDTVQLGGTVAGKVMWSTQTNYGEIINNLIQKVAEPQEARMLTININAGHGPNDPRGFKQIDNLPECGEGINNFRIYELIKVNLEMYKNVVVTTARPKANDNPSLVARAAMGRGADLQLAIHSNAGGGSGPVMLMRPDAPDDLVKLATSIRDKIYAKFDFKGAPRSNNYRALNGTPQGDWNAKRGDPRKSYYSEMRNSPISRTMLVEMAFHDHVYDSRVLRTQRQAFADAITEAIVAHYSLKPLFTGLATHITSGSVNFRAGSGMSYPIIRNIPEGTPVEVVAQPLNSPWLRVVVDGVIGYLHDNYVIPLVEDKPADPPMEDPVNGPYVNPEGERLYFRAVSGSYLTRGEAAEEVERLKTEGKDAWLQAVYVPIKEGK